MWTFPGNASDQVIIRKVKDDLRRLEPLAGDLGRSTAGSPPSATAATCNEAAGTTSSARSCAPTASEAERGALPPGRYHTVAGNLRVKQVRVDDGTNRDRFVICHNPERAERDELVREQILERLRQEIHHAGRACAVQARRALRRAFHQARLQALLAHDPDRQAPDRPRRGRQARPSSTASSCCAPRDESLTPADLALGYKALYEVERGWRDIKHVIDMRPAYHRREDRIEPTSSSAG